MKTKLISVLFLTFFFCFPLMADSAQPLKGDSFTAFGEYVMKPSSDPLLMGTKELVTYDLVYKNLNQVVKIAIDEKKNCRNFIVKHPSFEIQYICRKNGFGVCRIDKKYASLDEEFVARLMDNDQFSCQEILVSEARPTRELLHMIAGYFPKLINEDIRQLASAS